MITDKVKAIMGAVVLIVAIGATWHLTGLGYEAQIAKIRETAAKELAAQAESVLEKEREIKTLQTKLEKDFIDYEKKLITANDRFNARLNDALRLRDPGGSRCAADSATGTTTTSDGAGRGELSKEATGFLWSESTRADRVAGRLALCQQYVEVLQKELGGTTRHEAPTSQN